MEGQLVTIHNSDGTMHNVHTYAGLKGGKTLANNAQPPGAKALEKLAKADGADVIKLKCDVHPWMTGFVVIAKSPYFAVTGADGKFSLKDVPAGTYALEAWHERLGVKKATVTVKPGEPANVELSYSAEDRG
jgi:hypothetical protein